MKLINKHWRLAFIIFGIILVVLQLISNIVNYNNLFVAYDKINTSDGFASSYGIGVIISSNIVGLTGALLLIVSTFVVSIVNGIKERNWKRSGIIFGIMLMVLQLIFNFVVYKKLFGGYTAVNTDDLPKSALAVLSVFGSAIRANCIGFVGIIALNAFTVPFCISKKNQS